MANTQNVTELQPRMTSKELATQNATLREDVKSWAKECDRIAKRRSECLRMAKRA